MGFFDLNIPYYESDKTTANKSARKTIRLQLMIQAMELGYTGVAYNCTIRGVVADSDRCSIPLFPLASLIKHAPRLSALVEFHRKRLNVPVSAPFRQYTRLTVVVDNLSQASALNSGNPILRSFDIVSVKPLNQISFDHACQASEVDLIAIDFSDKLPFRMKQPMVKAAMERGIYFEITYSGLIVDSRKMKQITSSAELLVKWTQGKHIIFSSAAPSVQDLRGPYDVANLSYCLGISSERAKAAISKNCRSLITNALRKKHCYKDVIRVEPLIDHKHSGWLKWDPISSGDGDLLLDDIARSFSASNNTVKPMKAIDFSPSTGILDSHCLRINDTINEVESTSVECTVSTYQTSYHINSKRLCSPSHAIENEAQTEHPTNISELGTYSSVTSLDKPQTHNCVSHSDKSVMMIDSNTMIAVPKDDVPGNLIASCDNTNVSAIKLDESRRSNEDVTFGTQNFLLDVNVFGSSTINVSSIHHEEPRRQNDDVAIHNVLMDIDSTNGDAKHTGDEAFVSSKLSNKLPLYANSPKIEQCIKDDSVIPCDASTTTDCNDETNYEEDCSDSLRKPLDDIALEGPMQCALHTEINYSTLTKSFSAISRKSMPGKDGIKRRKSNPISFFPCRRLLHPIPFKKKARKSKNGI